jgi:Uma2 family endonuclease
VKRFLSMSTAPRYDETIMLPRAVRFPVEMMPPTGFDEERLETWPTIAGRLEFVEGRLLYMPPCGDEQQDTVTDVVIALGGWVRTHPAYVLGTNEAGMRLSGATRAADAAIWKRADLGAYTGGLRRVPPVLAVEVAGDATSDTEIALRDKASWYLQVGVVVVWIALPQSRSLLVVTSNGTTRLGAGESVPATVELPGLSLAVSELFLQLDTRRA